MNIAIRTATAADIAVLHEIRSAVRENRLSDPGSITSADYLPFIEAGGAWVAEMEGGVAGFAALDFKTGTVWALLFIPSRKAPGSAARFTGICLAGLEIRGFEASR